MVDASGAELVGVVDLGGTHVTAGVIRSGTFTIRPDRLVTRRLSADGDRDALIDAIVTTARAVHDESVRRWRIAVPGPFDYGAGIARFQGVGKFESLAGVDLRGALAEHLSGVAPDDITFLNDANAFLLGEWLAGAAHGHRRCVGLTLGTGVGSAFMVDATIVESGPGIPLDGRVDLLCHHGRQLEDVFSRRALLRAYGRADRAGFDVKDLIERAKGGEERAGRTIELATRALGETLNPVLAAFEPDCLVVGGSIAKAWRLLRAPLAESLTAVPSLRLLAPAKLASHGPLIGAAYDR